MTSEDLINRIETLGKINLSRKLRNWFKDNTFKLKLFVDENNFFVSSVSSLKEIYIHYNIFLQKDAKTRKDLTKVNLSEYVLIISKSGLVRLYKPSSN